MSDSESPAGSLLEEARQLREVLRPALRAIPGLAAIDTLVVEAEGVPTACIRVAVDPHERRAAEAYVDDIARELDSPVLIELVAGDADRPHKPTTREDQP